jgi:hypothetical protein
VSYIDLNTPYALAVIDGGSGLVLSDIFPSDDEYGVVNDDYPHELLGGMAAAELVEIQDLLGSLNRDNT